MESATHLSCHRGRWTLRYRDAAGVRHRKTLPADLTDTERAVIVEEAKAALGDACCGGTLCDSLALHGRDVAARYRSPRGMENLHRRAAGARGKMAMRDVTPAMADDLVHAFGVSASTFGTYVAYLRAARDEAARRGEASRRAGRGHLRVHDLWHMCAVRLVRLGRACAT